MKYIDEYRDKKLIFKSALKLKKTTPGYPLNFMEVCGTHTNSFFRFGLDRLLPKNIRLIAGPGCPVCVSTQEYIDQTIEIARNKENIVLSFGDMLRVPGSGSTLEKERAKGADIRVVYSPLEALSTARSQPRKRIVFLAVGFETTAPAIALTLLQAKKENLKNIFFLTSLKLIPPAMEFLLKDKRLRLNGFLCPGHVSAIIGTSPYLAISRKYRIGCCVSGFEPTDIMEGLLSLARQAVKGKPSVENQYIRVVKREGNKKAKKIISRVFKVTGARWRGLGEIPKSGLILKKEFGRFNAMRFLKHGKQHIVHNTRCRCADVLKGLIYPGECPLFKKACRPDNPFGPCMVSSEGACHAYFKYRRN